MTLFYFFIMRRNFKAIYKFFFISGITIVCTVLLYKIFIRKFRNEVSSRKSYLSKTLFGPEDILILSGEKIDWHNYTLMEDDFKREGPGEQGKPYVLKSNEMDNYEALYKMNGFNAALSDKLALDRSVPDIRNPGCKNKKYLKKLPSVSVIVPFHNEHWSTLLRTAHSVVKRSPPTLLKEVILVDDASTKEFSRKKLDDYLASNLSKVRAIHLPVRSGLIRARLAGAKQAIADVLVFLDSHTETNVNWLPPLLEPIAQDYKTCVCPFIDVIQYENFEYKAQDEGARGAFDWEFFYKRLPLLPEDLEHPTEPFKSPVMAGGLFAISAKFFWELGGYDEGLDIWGGEQYELSFKIWQCGGQMLDAPCSRVGHIYRKYAPFPNPGKGDFVGRNYKRVAEVWMDEYAKYLYMRRPHYKSINPGNLSKQKEIRKSLHCKPFKWFMEKVAFDLPLKYPPIEPDDFGSGEVRNVGVPELCVDAGDRDKDSVVKILKCANSIVKKADQNFTLTWHKDVRVKGKSLCWDVSDLNDKADVTLFPCHGMKGNQYWKYDIDKQWFMHGVNGRCLDCDPGTMKLFVRNCDDSSKTQKWRLENVNLTMLANWDNIGVV